MSLADLPDNLIAHLTTYLSYPDVWSLMETSKKTYNAIKGYKKDKIALKSVRLYKIRRNNFGYECISDDKVYQLKNLKISNDPTNMINNILRESSFVNNFSFERMSFDSSIFMALKETKTRIQSLSIKGGDITSTAEEFIFICQKLKKIELNTGSRGLRPEMWTDEFFTKVLPFTRMEIYGTMRNTPVPVALSDRTLEALVDAKKDFNIAELCTQFTVKGIAKVVQKLHGSGPKPLAWDLGILSSAQFDDADRYFKDRTGEMAPYVITWTTDYGDRFAYRITLLRGCHDIYFTVLTPP